MNEPGLLKKFDVDPTTWPGANAVLVGRYDGAEHHAMCEYLVLDLHHDVYAAAAVRAYAAACAKTHPKLGADMMKLAVMVLGKTMGVEK